MADQTQKDILYDIARRAYYNTSFDPEKRAESSVNALYADLKEKREQFEKLAKTDEQKKILEDEWPRFETNYIVKQKDIWYAQSRTASPMITGPARFPVESNRKKMQSEMNKREAFSEWINKAERAIENKIEPSMYQVSSDRADAPDLLRKELSQLEKNQSQMIIVNKILRKKNQTQEEKIEQVVKETDFDRLTAKKLTEPGVMGGDGGFYSFELRNNSAKIKRLKERIETIEKLRSQSTKEFKFEGGEIIDNVEENRLQIKYDGKPSSEVISNLKHNGFKWSPTRSVWQRMRGGNANYALKRVLEGKVISKKETTVNEEIKEKAIPTEKENVYKMPESDVKPEKEKPIGYRTRTIRMNIDSDPALELVRQKYPIMASKGRKKRTVKKSRRQDKPATLKGIRR
jgi:hypothetical protein